MCDLCYILGMSGPGATVTRDTLYQRREDMSVKPSVSETDSERGRYTFRENKTLTQQELVLTEGQMATQRKTAMQKFNKEFNKGPMCQFYGGV